MRGQERTHEVVAGGRRGAGGGTESVRYAIYMCTWAGVLYIRERKM
jgi:hypothetical protein